MFSRTIIPLLVIISLFDNYETHASPVLLWSNGDLPRLEVPLSALSSLKLISDSICKLPSEKIQLRLFSVKNLNQEDIHYGSQNLHNILLAAKESDSRFRYFPEVINSVYNTFVSIPKSNNMYCAHIHFDVTSNQEYETLHDGLNAMEASINSLGSDNDKTVVMALVGNPVTEETVARSRRSIEDQEDVLVSDDETCMFYAKQLRIQNGTSKDSSANISSYTLDLDSSHCVPGGWNMSNGTNSSVVLNLVWTDEINKSDTIPMTINVEIVGQYWYLQSVYVADEEYRYFAYGMHNRMDTPPTFSYVCTTATFIRYNSSSHFGSYDFTQKLFIKNMQFQPFYANGSYFGPPNYCTSFFTSGIWMGITSSLVCLGILLFGVYRLMCIQSNDRFDDPKGKPLVIKAQE